MYTKQQTFFFYQFIAYHAHMASLIYEVLQMNNWTSSTMMIVCYCKAIVYIFGAKLGKLI